MSCLKMQDFVLTNSRIFTIMKTKKGDSETRKISGRCINYSKHK